MPETPATETLRPDLGALWRHRALVVAALYAFVALVGALYYALLLGDFGLNPFHYWEASDFLLATFREPLSIAFGLFAVFFYFSMTRGREMNDAFYGSIPLVRRLTLYDRWRDSPWMAPRFGIGVSLLMAVAWFVVVMGGMATGVAADARRGEGRAVRYALGDGVTRDAQLLTTTNRFVFLVEPGPAPRDAVLRAVPIESLVELAHCGARRGGLRALIRGAEACAPPAAPAAAPAPVPATAPTAAAPATVVP